MTTAVRHPPTEWEPDPLLPDVAQAGGVRLLDLPHPEQCWLVAQLTAHGLTADEIANRCGCGLRKIRYLRADPLTIMIGRWIVAEARAAAHAQRVETLDRWCHTALGECEQSTGRVRDQLAGAVDQISALRNRCQQEQQRARLYRKYLGTPRPRRSRPTADVEQLALF